MTAPEIAASEGGGLVAAGLAEEGRALDLYRRGPGGLATSRVPLAPFVLVTDPAASHGLEGVVERCRLEGPGELRWLLRLQSWPHALAARDGLRRTGAPHWFVDDPFHHYLLVSGERCFTGMRFEDLRRLAVDIEVVTTEGRDFPNAARAADRIVAIALAGSDGFRTVLRGDELPEPALLEACAQLIRARDPDVIEGHNIFRFDLEYLDARARRHGLALTWGRRGEAVHGRPDSFAAAGRSVKYRRFQVPGRHVVDTWMLAQLHDAGARDLPSLGLKALARHFGVAAPGRTYVDPASITRAFAGDAARLMAYAGDDAAETLALAGILAPPYFLQAQLVPFDYQATILRGAGAKIDALLLRDYLGAGHAVPLPRPPGPVSGAHTAIYRQGVARPVLHADVTSLYPFLMLAGDIAPATDPRRSFSRLLRSLTEVRLDAKRAARTATDPTERTHLQARQQAFKILINAFYGYLAFSGGHWNDYAAADRVTTEGRRVVETMVARLEAAGATPVEVDTDGVYFVPPTVGGPEAAEDLLAHLAGGLPPGIQIELTGPWAAMFSYKVKTYALLDGTGAVILRGSAFRSRGLEPFQRTVIEEIVRLLLAGRGADVKTVIERWLGDFAVHRVPVRAFARTETLHDGVETYRARVASGARPPSAAYEVALTAGLPLAPGDQVSYYVTGRGAHPAVHECARLASRWRAEAPDENVEYYQARVLEIWARFRPFAEREGLRPCPQPEDAPGAAQLDLFGSSAENGRDLPE